MSLLSNFFEKRNQGDNQHTNNAFASIFSNPTPVPSPKIIAPKPVIAAEVLSQQAKSSKQKSPQANSNGESVALSRRMKSKAKKQAAASKMEQENQNNEEPENLDSTIFVGNVPISSTHKSISKFFSKFGKVAKVWFRSIPVEQSKIPKKGLHILKKYQEGADSMNAYVKFEKEEDAKKACQANGEEMEEKNIKVTLCNEFDLDYESTIFIGNLPRKLKDQELWDAFKSVGTVKSVRIIRNKDTMEGIGIGYVRFANKEEMRNAITQMNGKKIGDRQMRIKKAVSKERLEKKVRRTKEKKQQMKKNYQAQRTEERNNKSQNDHEPNSKPNFIAKTKKIHKEDKHRKPDNNFRQDPTGPRGGPREGSRGGPREGPREGPRGGSRGGPREGPRGDQRGAQRGYQRGGKEESGKQADDGSELRTKVKFTGKKMILE